MLESTTRRTFTLGLAGAIAAAMLPRRARAASGKILILGGSTMHGALGQYFEDALSAAGYSSKRHAKSASGLARPDFYDWPAAVKKDVAGYSPDAAIVNFGGNDGQALFMGEDEQPKWIRWEEDAAWKAEYRARVDAFADLLAPAGQQIFWLGMPEMKSNKLDGRMKRMNTIFEAAMNARPNGHYLPMRGLIPGVRGYAEFATIGGKELRVRAQDGVHYSIHGARIVTEAIVPEVVQTLGG